MPVPVNSTAAMESGRTGGDAQLGSTPAPIGVFDSGIGGLTVAAALRELLPSEDVFYIGDTARVPYGSKGPETIERYSRELAGLLVVENAKVIVVACNTASALGMRAMREKFSVPIVGVIEPGASAAVAATRNGQIGVIGTRATIFSRAYERAIHALAPDASVHSLPCPLLVPLIEEGWLNDAITDQVVERYLAPLLAKGVDTLVLGCTHYPLLREAIARFAGADIVLVDSARNCAQAVQELLQLNQIAGAAQHLGRLRVALTDKSTAFLRVAEEALALQVGDIELRHVQGIAAA